MYRDAWAEIDLTQIRENVMKIRQFLPGSAKLMAVVKANAYGHGDIETAKEAVQAGADYLGVAFIEEAIRLRNAGLKQPILILTPIRPELTSLALEYDLMLTVTRASWFQEMRAYKPVNALYKLYVHVKMDTGLGRIGIRTLEEWQEIVPWLTAPDIVVDGFYTHFATAGEADSSYLELQLQRFQEMKEWSKMLPIPINHYHCAGSVAALRFPELSMDMVRIGAAIYGFYPEMQVTNIKLKPAFSLHSRLIQTKRLKKGEYVGYNNAYQTKTDQWIGTVPIGYADGWSQRMQNTEVLVEGCRAEIVGKISMDQLMVKLPKYFPEGTKVTFMGCSGEEKILIPELANHIGSVSQEITSSITDRVARIYRNSGGSQHETIRSRTNAF
ncbi:alanine racemase 1 [Paenibacillus albidus]|uniref:Alanine racemase n=1 Tax=Paenibacillus albidus TaxID=2041023 RepID=A0A917C6P6_9BACL|nr:alanine racemase [Paenibacillus albidus]GGF70583.1 alanine racemase 1 [Paenibacillus albidus]